MLKKIQYTGNLNRTLLLANLIPTILLLIVITLAFVTIFIGEIEDDLEEINKMILANISDKINHLTESQRMLSYEIYHNDVIMELAEDDNRNRYVTLRTRNYLNDVFISNKSFYSIYILNQKEILLHMGGSVRHEERHGELYPLFSSDQEYFKPFPRVIEGEEEPFHVISVIFSRPTANNDDNTHIIVNYEASSLLEGSMNINSQMYYITGIKGEIIDYTESILDNRDLLILNEQILKKSRSYQSEKIRYLGKEYIIHSVLTSDELFRVVSLSDLRYFLRKTLMLRNQIIGISLIILFLELVVSLYFSKSIYEPVFRLFSSISERITGFDQKRSVRIHSKELTDSFHSFIERLNNLEDYHGRTIERGRKNFLFRVLHEEEDLSEENFVKAMDEYELFKRLDGTNLLGVVKVDGLLKLKQDHSSYSQAFQMASIEGVFQEQLNRFGEVITNAFSSSYLVFLLHGEKPYQSIPTGSLKQALEEIKDLIHKMMGISLSIGISPSFYSLTYKNLSQSFREADQYTNYRIFLGQGRTITENDLTQFKKTSPIINATARDVSEFILRGDDLGFNRYLDQCWNKLRTYQYETVLYIFSSIAQEISKEIVELETKQSQNYSLPSIQKALKKHESFEEIKEYLVDLFIKLKGVLDKRKQAVSEATIKEILDFIDEELSNSQLSAYLAAEKIGISPSYFSRSFQKYTGKTFPEYVMEVRLEHTRKALLSEPGSSIKEIGTAFGFSSNTYFTTSFKKKYAVPPSQYRNLHKH